MNNNFKNLNKSSQGYFIIIIAVLTWSFSEIIVKLLQNSVGPLTLSFFRFLIGGIFLLLILIIKNDLKGIGKMIKENWILLLVASCLALGISNVIYFVGITLTQANIGATIYTTYPIWITIYSIIILNERTNLKLKFIGIVIGIFGIAILMTNCNFSGFLSSQYLLGNLLVLLGSIIWSFYSVLGKKVQINEKDTPNIALKLSMVSFFLACIPIFLILIFTTEFNTFLEYDLNAWFWIIFIGIISTGLGIYLLFIGLQYIEVSKGISLAFLKPIFATLLAYFFLKENPTLMLFISISLVMASIILINQDLNGKDTFSEKKGLKGHSNNNI
ncbi:MAG: DMT family transporter [Promethearchaeota archaeon]